MKFDIDPLGPPLNLADLRKFEARNRLKLPQDLIDFLLAHNGVAMNSWESDRDLAYRIQGHPRQQEGLLQCLYALDKKQPWNDLEQVHRVHKGRLPAALLAIGNDPGDNLICIGLTGERQGRIYWWERGREAARPTFRSVFLVANSLPEFLAGLYPFECEVIMPEPARRRRRSTKTKK
jgi:cell wall assembly regulator SMI1